MSEGPEAFGCNAPECESCLRAALPQAYEPHPVDDEMPLGEEYIPPSERMNCPPTQVPTNQLSLPMNLAPIVAPKITSPDIPTDTLIALDVNTLNRVRSILQVVAMTVPAPAAESLKEALRLLNTHSPAFPSVASPNGPAGSGITVLEPSLAAALISLTTGTRLHAN